MNDKKIAFKCTFEGSHFIARTLDVIVPEIENSEQVGEKYEIEVIEISDEELDALPEFDGW